MSRFFRIIGVISIVGTVIIPTYVMIRHALMIGNANLEDYLLEALPLIVMGMVLSLSLFGLAILFDRQAEQLRYIRWLRSQVRMKPNASAEPPPNEHYAPPWGYRQRISSPLLRPPGTPLPGRKVDYLPGRQARMYPTRKTDQSPE